MKTEMEVIAQMTLEEFAERHDLTLVIHERRLRCGDPMRFYAAFKNVEVSEPGVLVGAYGNGATQEEATRNYAPEISLKRLVVDAYKTTRREIDVPRLT